MSSKSSRVISFQTEISKESCKETKPKKTTHLKSKQKGDAKSDIDDIFSELKGKQRKAAEEKQKEEEKAKRREENGGKKKIRRTEEGYRIYTLEELGLDKNKFGGNTPLCPFDCDCCH
ncbi:hypothetical protein, conserved [Entamoeba dispar SAW760]|uniref:DUF1764 domain-containing protein n=1 Tax=Entamoeba dispar (strain ATCC PRA-260 / SAW760) TaxID=370354 RepID=B0EUR8_ENTDS|nr:uncharacterized protein EDI_161570 [Entamoeba dispar SAW760]EDR21712.1 hypothetical protein, conserved [Entamoeba dispar SAW760]|eukprot:EDR21712.1 hypothetical protein, conserved [Entamoeba dispar SAW760]